jgi:hypothetical protein
MATKSEKSERIKTQTLSYYQAIAEGTIDVIEATNKVVELNIALVSEVLKKYKPWDEDNFQIGCRGLINAARTYQVSREVPFASYAGFCIEREIQLAHRKKMESEDVFNLDESQKVRLDAPAMQKDNGEAVENYELIFDENAEEALEKYIQENELTYISENIIKPAIIESSPKQNSQTRANIPGWQKAEFLYIMDIVFIDSQKQRITLKDVAAASNLSVQNVRIKHLAVMQLLFQRMWFYMGVPFNELLDRLRGTKTIPERLLCLDPGKTTGWCLFEHGRLTKTGHVENCFDDTNIDTAGLYQLFEELNPDFILYEDYKVYAHKLERHVFNPVFTLRLIGAIESYAQIKKIPSHKQMAVTAKNFVTDEKLKQWGLWQTGMRHARDAIRHGCYFLLFYKKGENIL